MLSKLKILIGVKKAVQLSVLDFYLLNKSKVYHLS